MQNLKLKQIIGAVVGLSLIVGGVWFFGRETKVEETVEPEIVLEPTMQIKNNESLEMPMTEAEKKEIEEAFFKEGMEMTVLNDVVEGQAVGTAWRQYSGSGGDFRA